MAPKSKKSRSKSAKKSKGTSRSRASSRSGHHMVTRSKDKNLVKFYNTGTRKNEWINRSKTWQETLNVNAKNGARVITMVKAINKDGRTLNKITGNQARSKSASS